MPVRKVSYCYLTVPNRAGQGAKVLSELKSAKVNLLAYSGFPTTSGQSQLDLVADNLATIKRVAKSQDWRLSKVKKGFLIQGKDRPGAVLGHIGKLADAGINVTAAEAVVAGKGRYGMLLWVKAADYGRASRTLKAR